VFSKHDEQRENHEQQWLVTLPVLVFFVAISVSEQYTTDELLVSVLKAGA
jgi:hypothetical protein